MLRDGVGVGGGGVNGGKQTYSNLFLVQLSSSCVQVWGSRSKKLTNRYLSFRQTSLPLNVKHSLKTAAKTLSELCHYAYFATYGSNPSECFQLQMFWCYVVTTRVKLVSCGLNYYFFSVGVSCLSCDTAQLDEKSWEHLVNFEVSLNMTYTSGFNN